MHQHQTLIGPHPAIELPCPPRELHPNERKSWQAKHKARKAYRTDCGVIVEQYCKTRFNALPRWEEAVVKLEFLYGKQNCKPGGTRKLHDNDNVIAWCKSAIDSLSDGGLLIDDRKITYLPPSQKIVDGLSDTLLIIAWEGKLAFPGIGG